MTGVPVAGLARLRPGLTTRDPCRDVTAWPDWVKVGVCVKGKDCCFDPSGSWNFNAAFAEPEDPPDVRAPDREGQGHPQVRSSRPSSALVAPVPARP